MSDFDPGEVWDALNDHRDHEARAKQVNSFADELVALCADAVQDMAHVALDEGDCDLAEEVAEHGAAFVEKLAKTALHVALTKWKAANPKEAA